MRVFALLAIVALQEPVKTSLAISGERFTVGGSETFLYGISYYGALGARDDTLNADLAEMRRWGFNWIRVWATWAAFGEDVSAVDAKGNVREGWMLHLKAILSQCDRLGLVVDVTLSRGNGVTGPARLQDAESHRRAVEALVSGLKEFRNWYLDLSNERNIKDRRHTTFEELAALRARVRELDPSRLVTASHAGDISREDLAAYVKAGVDFIAPHRPRNAASPAETEAKTRTYRAWLKEAGRPMPVHYQEPFRRDFGNWNPSGEDFMADARGARAGGAAGWCLHNGDARSAPEGRPRRSFDLREKGLFEQLDAEERQALDVLKSVFPAH
jgi:hypothetical protein